MENRVAEVVRYREFVEKMKKNFEGTILSKRYNVKIDTDEKFDHVEKIMEQVTYDLEEKRRREHNYIPALLHYGRGDIDYESAEEHYRVKRFIENNNYKPNLYDFFYNMSSYCRPLSDDDKREIDNCFSALLPDALRMIEKQIIEKLEERLQKKVKDIEVDSLVLLHETMPGLEIVDNSKKEKKPPFSKLTIWRMKKRFLRPSVIVLILIALFI